jgi:hybrid cluster-associated redox disulfide protein
MLRGSNTQVESPSLNPQTSIADLIAAWPQVIPVFLRRKMNCVGCSMSGFETIEDAARIYELDFDEFYTELVELAFTPPTR